MRYDFLVFSLLIFLPGIRSYGEDLAEYMEQREALMAMELVYHFDYNTPFSSLEMEGKKRRRICDSLYIVTKMSCCTAY
jgi:hypothetical protein